MLKEKHYSDVVHYAHQGVRAMQTSSGYLESKPISISNDRESKMQHDEFEPYLLHTTITFRGEKGILFPIEELTKVELHKQYDFEVEVEIEDKCNRDYILEKLEICVSSENIEIKSEPFHKLQFDSNKIARPQVSLIPRSARNNEIVLNFGFLQDYRLVCSIPVPLRVVYG